MRPNVNYRLWVIMYQYGEGSSWGSYVYVRAGDRRKLSVLYDEFSCEPITAIKNKVHLNGKYERKKLQNI